MTQTERELRLRLAACYRVFAMLGWTEMIYNHITVRLPDSVTGGEKQFLINPFGLHYSEVTAPQPGQDRPATARCSTSRRWPVNPAGFTVHAAIHDGLRRRALRDAHAHHRRRGGGLRAGRPVAEQLLFRAAARHGGVPRLRGHHDPCRRRAAPAAEHRQPAGRDPAQPRPAGLGPHAAADLRRPVDACSAPARSRWRRSRWAPRFRSPTTIARRCTRDALQFHPDHGGGQDVFDALVRQVDRIDPGYRD